MIASAGAKASAAGQNKNPFRIVQLLEHGPEGVFILSYAATGLILNGFNTA